MSDQSQVSAEAWDGSFKTQMDCDQVEDGIAATWKAFAGQHELSATLGFDAAATGENEATEPSWLP